MSGLNCPRRLGTFIVRCQTGTPLKPTVYSSLPLIFLLLAFVRVKFWKKTLYSGKTCVMQFHTHEIHMDFSIILFDISTLDRHAVKYVSVNILNYHLKISLSVRQGKRQGQINPYCKAIRYLYIEIKLKCSNTSPKGDTGCVSLFC